MVPTDGSRLSQGPPPQIDPLTLEKNLRTWAYHFSNHATERLQERSITIPEVKYVLRNGSLEPAKHKFDPDNGDWTYAVRGTTIDGRELRVIVAIDDNLLIVTVIDLDK